MDAVDKLRIDLDAMWIDVTALEVLTRALMTLVRTPADRVELAAALEGELKAFGLMAFAGPELAARAQAARAVVEEHVRRVRDDLRLCA